MERLRDLYQEVILQHSRKPHNFGKLEGDVQHAEGFNPLCGDQVKVYIALKDGIVKDIHFEGAGCAISTASASMMTDILKGKARSEVEQLFQRFQAMLTGREDKPEELGKLEVFSQVHAFPMRVKCATLAWHTMAAALNGKQEVVSTE